MPAGARPAAQRPTGPKETRGQASRWLGPYLRGPSVWRGRGQTSTGNCVLPTEGSAVRGTDRACKSVQRWVGRLSVKSQMVNILGFGGHRVSVPTTQLGHSHGKQTRTMSTDGCGVLPYKQRRVGLGPWPTSPSVNRGLTWVGGRGSGGEKASLRQQRVTKTRRLIQ